MDIQGTTAAASSAATSYVKQSAAAGSSSYADAASAASGGASSGTASTTSSAALSSDTIASVLNLVQEQSSSGSYDIHSMTISQIRDVTDQLAVDGKLSIHQQMQLIGDGLLDPNPADPSYQPPTPVGYSRSDTETYDFSSMVAGYAAFDEQNGLTEQAASWQDIGQTVTDYLAGLDSGKAVG